MGNSGPEPRPVHCLGVRVCAAHCVTSDRFLEPGCMQALELLRRELDGPPDRNKDKSTCACTMLLEPNHEPLLKAIGWDLLHSFLPFVDAGACIEAAAPARRLLLRVAMICNPREMFSMVMEAFVFFKVPVHDREALPWPCLAPGEPACVMRAPYSTPARRE
jgi:hypothetical protein